MANDVEKVKEDPRMNDLEVIVREMAGDDKSKQEAIIRDLAGRLSIWELHWGVYMKAYKRTVDSLHKRIKSIKDDEDVNAKGKDLLPGLKYACIVLNNQLRFGWNNAGQLVKKEKQKKEKREKENASI